MIKIISEKNYIHLLEDALDHVSESVYISNLDGSVVFMNQEAERADGLDRREELGKTEEEIFGTQNHSFVVNHAEAILNEKITYVTKSGEVKFVHHSVYPCQREDKIIGTFSVSKDITKIDNYISKIYKLQRELKGKSNQTGKNGTSYTLNSIIGKSLPMIKAIRMAQRASQFSTNILIYGETGTGKELFAQSIHNESDYADTPFVGLNCAAIPENLLESTLFGTEKGAYTGAVTMPGLFEQAGEGTLFFDEIDSLPMTMQAKLLRAIQEKKMRRIGGKQEIPIRCRIISATNINIDKAISENRIRPDLYYRLASVIIEIPPLRERKGDILLLADYFIKKCRELYGTSIETLDSDVAEIFTLYSWPGNVRELEHLIESISILSEEDNTMITLHHLPEKILSAASHREQRHKQSLRQINLNELTDEYERSLIVNALKENNGNISATAKSLQLHRNALYSKMKRLGIKQSRM